MPESDGIPARLRSVPLSGDCGEIGGAGDGWNNAHIAAANGRNFQGLLEQVIARADKKTLSDRLHRED